MSSQSPRRSSNALTSVFQRMGVEDAPEESTMRLSLMAHAIRRGVWLLGFGFMICSFLLQSFALHIGRLSVVQPILTMELLFLVAILGTYFRFSISAARVDRGGGHRLRAVGLPLLRRPGWRGRGAHQPGLDRRRRQRHLPHRASPWSPPAGVHAGGRRRCSGARRPSPIAFTAALIKMVSNYAANDWVTMFEHWQTYGVIAFGLLGLFLTQNAFHAGPLAASQSTLVLVDPLVSICLGIALYGDTLRTSGAYGPLEALSLLVMFMGAVFLSNSPLITGMKSEGKGVEYDEMLSRRLKHPQAEAVADGGLPSRRLIA